MAIINGAFDTNISGWTPTTGGNADVLWDSSGPTPGRMRLREYQCAQPCKVSQTFIIDNTTLSFDWQTSADQWYENPGWKLTVGTTVVKNEGFSVGHATGYSGTKSIDVSSYIGQTATIEFSITPSSYCGVIDHANTYLWIDNVALSGTQPILCSNIGFTGSNYPCPTEYTCTSRKFCTQSMGYRSPPGEHFHDINIYDSSDVYITQIEFLSTDIGITKYFTGGNLTLIAYSGIFPETYTYDIVTGCPIPSVTLTI